MEGLGEGRRREPSGVYPLSHRKTLSNLLDAFLRVLCSSVVTCYRLSTEMGHFSRMP
ncbi:hypothetical protein K2D_33300 [Planctomycetes bacterium K2D]|uniref:Uncharacterized protein n=1 Tax=Botrimarina mediterranea TaxID=2528022 RepID=A0A518KBC2_9BACT|nr:hypothetical protein Spa11_32780 [Botrimarina mediterranea]QDV79715.1 hypothetical protein K2D_33300 [Planctomycetes bacterium K2D]